jgi:hypothetical protein
LIAARITVAAFQVALAAESDQVRSQLQARLKVVPLGSSWRSAVTIGLEPALGMLAEILRLNRFRLAGELVVATTRAQLNPHPEPLAEDRPRLAMLPVGPVIHWLVEHEGLPELKDHLAALVEQELRGHPEVAERVRAFWEQALPDVPIRVDDPDATALPEPVLDEVLQVALGFRDRAGRPIRSGGLAGLLGHSPVTGHRTPAEPEPAPPDPAAPTAPDRPRWWRRWVDQLWTSP